jgi:uncharacterized protein YjbI with pentapeptide repeats
MTAKKDSEDGGAGKAKSAAKKPSPRKPSKKSAKRTATATTTKKTTRAKTKEQVPDCAYEDCHEPQWDGSAHDLCIYHAPENGRDEKAARRVWEKARKDVGDNGGDFRGWHFPADPDGKSFQGCEFPADPDGRFFQGCQRHDADFRWAHFSSPVSFAKAVFRNGANFRLAVFHHDVQFNDAVFEKHAMFGSSTFEGEAWFFAVVFAAGVDFSPVTNGPQTQFLSYAMFADAKVHSATTNFRTCRFDGEASFKRAWFEKATNFRSAAFRSVHFDNATFAEKADFDGATVSEKASFRSSRFEEDARFPRATFEGLVNFQSVTFGTGDFTEATFKGDADFRRTHFSYGGVFRSASFLADAKFDGVASGCQVTFDLPSCSRGTCQPFAVVSRGATAYRLAKQSAQDTGNYRDASRYHLAEQCAIEHGKRRESVWRVTEREFWRLKNLRRVIPSSFEFVVIRCVFGYGEQPWRVAATAMVVIVCCALIFGLTRGIKATTEGLHTTPWTYLHFSVVTFTTLGYGDFVPEPYMRFLADGEALLGAGLMALFIVALAKKYTR